MIVDIKSLKKLMGISIISCCAAFVCTLFLNYNIDLIGIRNMITTEAGKIFYEATVSTGKIVSFVSGGCLVVTSIFMLVFYIKNYIDAHCKELGILKAIGYKNFKIAKHFWVFGLSVFVGCILGFILAYLYLPSFYKIQNEEKLFPEFGVTFHPLLAVALIVIPTIVFALISILYAYWRLNCPVINLLKERKNYKIKITKRARNDMSFLKELKRATINSNKMLAFLIIFSSFCFSAMVQMSISMNELTSKTFAIMIIVIGLILAFTTLLLSLSSVISGNKKTFAMMNICGYEQSVCRKSIISVYRPFSYIGFIIGTLYQYALLKIMVSIVFVNVENMPKYNFDILTCLITFVLFVISYEIIMYCYSLRIKRIPIKSIMLEQ